MEPKIPDCTNVQHYCRHLCMFLGPTCAPPPCMYSRVSWGLALSNCKQCRPQGPNDPKGTSATDALHQLNDNTNCQPLWSHSQAHVSQRTWPLHCNGMLCNQPTPPTSEVHQTCPGSHFIHVWHQCLHTGPSRSWIFACVSSVLAQGVPGHNYVMQLISPQAFSDTKPLPWSSDVTL